MDINQTDNNDYPTSGITKKKRYKRRKGKKSSACVGLSVEDCIFPCKTVKKNKNMAAYGHCRTLFSKRSKYIDAKTKKVIRDKLKSLRKTAKKADLKRKIAEYHEQKSDQYEKKAEVEEKSANNLFGNIYSNIKDSLGLSGEKNADPKELPPVEKKEPATEEGKEEEEPVSTVDETPVEEKEPELDTTTDTADTADTEIVDSTKSDEANETGVDTAEVEQPVEPEPEVEPEVEPSTDETVPSTASTVIVPDSTESQKPTEPNKV
jgi:hypothetical protein